MLSKVGQEHVAKRSHPAKFSPRGPLLSINASELDRMWPTDPCKLFHGRPSMMLGAGQMLTPVKDTVIGDGHTHS
jgi:hypothetical protein